MSEAYIGEIRIFGFNFAPLGWATCDGQLLPIAQYSALFAIIGTFYGGNGTTNFALPNFQGDTGVNQGTGPGLSTYEVGEQSGFANVTLLVGQLPTHNHTINTLDAATGTQGVHTPTTSAYLGNSHPDRVYNNATPSPTTAFNAAAIGISGQNQPHPNMQPYQVQLFCISLEGVFPVRG